MKEDFREWREHKKKTRSKMIGCPWADYQHKTWAGEVCMRCNRMVDENGDPVFEKVQEEE